MHQHTSGRTRLQRTANVSPHVCKYLSLAVSRCCPDAARPGREENPSACQCVFQTSRFQRPGAHGSRFVVATLVGVRARWCCDRLVAGMPLRGIFPKDCASHALVRTQRSLSLSTFRCTSCLSGKHERNFRPGRGYAGVSGFVYVGVLIEWGCTVSDQPSQADEYIISTTLGDVFLLGTSP